MSLVANRIRGQTVNPKPSNFSMNFVDEIVFENCDKKCGSRRRIFRSKPKASSSIFIGILCNSRRFLYLVSYNRFHPLFRVRRNLVARKQIAWLTICPRCQFCVCACASFFVSKTLKRPMEQQVLWMTFLHRISQSSFALCVRVPSLPMEKSNTHFWPEKYTQHT